MLMYITKAIQTAGEKMHSTCNGNNKAKSQPEWFDDECVRLKAVKYQNLRKFRNTGSMEDLQRYKQSKEVFKQTCKCKKEEYKEGVREKLLSLMKEPTKVWKYLKSLQTGITGSNNSISADEWYQYFKALFEQCAGNQYIEDNESDIVNENYMSTDALNDTITEDEVSQAIHKLKINKSAGNDGLISEFFKYGVDILIPSLTKLFNFIFSQGKFPAQWRKAIIITLHKKGDKGDPNNYRDISLLSVFAKIFTSILNARLMKWSENAGKLSESQAGFRKNYRTVDNVFVLHGVISKYLSKKGGKLYCIFVDFSKAFDSVNRSKLFVKLNKVGIQGKIFKIIKNMYSEVYSSVRVGGLLTESFNCPVGVRQGCMLSPLLFILFLNELVDKLEEEDPRGVQLSPSINEIQILMYADDIAIFADTIGGLQRKINILQDYCNEWSLSVNLSKTQVVVFKNGGTVSRNEKWYFQNQKIETVSFYKYLGVTMSCRNKWSRNVENLVAQTTKVSFQLNRYLKSVGTLPYHVFFKLFNTIVLPAVCYGASKSTMC